MVAGPPFSEIKVVFDSDDLNNPHHHHPHLLLGNTSASETSEDIFAKLNMSEQTEVCPPRWERGVVRTREKQLKKTKPPSLIPPRFPEL